MLHTQRSSPARWLKHSFLRLPQFFAAPATLYPLFLGEHRMLRTLLLCSCVMSVAFAQPLPQSFGSSAQKHPFRFEDMMSLKRVADPQVSPDGRWLMFSA